MNGLERLAGSVLCVGLPATEADAATLTALESLAPGGIVLFERNVSSPEGTRALVAAASAAANAAASDGLPPLIAVDQEGGRVARLRAGAAPIPSMMALAATGDLTLAHQAGAVLAHDLRRFGATVDFAPVLDLALDPAATVVGVRAFSDDAQLVAAFGAAVIRGLAAGGVVAVAKHFPGHGATAVDSHEALPVVRVSEETLGAREYVPFRAAIAAGVPAIMAAHVAFAAFDAALPATLSERILRGELRGKLGFRGAVFSDCLEMAAIANATGSVRAAVLGLAAGLDCVLLSHHLALALEARDAIVAAVRAGTLTQARLEEAAQRMLHLRRSAVDGAARAPSEAVDGNAVARSIAARSITAVRGDLTLDANRPITVVSFEGAAGPPASLSLALRRLRLRSESLRVPIDPDAAMLEHLGALLAAQGGRQHVLVTRRAHLHPAQCAAVKEVLALAPDAVVVSALEPFDAACFPSARRSACTYGDQEVTFDALAEVLAGRAPASGHLPVSLAVA